MADAEVAAIAAEETAQVEAGADAHVEIAQIEADARTAEAAEETKQARAMADAAVGVAEAQNQGLAEWQERQTAAMETLAAGQAATALALERLTSLLTPTAPSELVVVEPEAVSSEAEPAAVVEVIAEPDAEPNQDQSPSPNERPVIPRRRRIAF
jgi:hypothetical protein